MNQDIKSQLDRAKNLLKELEQSAQADLNKQEISSVTKNLTQEVLLKMNRIFDQSWRSIFMKHYAPKLSKEEIEKTKIYFPIALKPEDLKSVLGRYKMTDLETDHPDLFKWLASIQPYNQNQNWLSLCKKYADDSHIQLTPQTRTETKRIKVSAGGASISMPFGNPSFQIHQGSNCQIFLGGQPIRFSGNDVIPLSPNVTKEIETWVSFSFKDTDLNVLWLCKNAVEQGEKIVEKVFSFIK